MDQYLASPQKRTFALGELVDMIIDQLAEDRNSLKYCSLLSKQWVPRCRYHLLKVVAFVDSPPGHSLERWCATFGATNAPTAAILTRELHFLQERRLWIHPRNLTRHVECLSHFTKVTTLVFANLVMSVFDPASMENCLKPLATSVRSLRLCHPTACPPSLMQFVLLFTAAADIQISSPRWSAVNNSVAFHPPLQKEVEFSGVLHLRGFDNKWSAFFMLLSSCRLKFKKTRLLRCEFSTSVPTQALLEAASQSTSALHLTGVGKQLAYSSITLRTFHVLENLAFGMTEEGISGVELARLLDSIPSLNFSLLALDVCSREKRQADCRDAQTKRFLGEMKALDRPLCRLANRALQGTGERFTLILLANNPNAIDGSFADFRKVGNTWKGAKLIGSRGYYWTFEAAKDCEDQTPDDSVLRFICI